MDSHETSWEIYVMCSLLKRKAETVAHNLEALEVYKFAKVLP